MTLANGNSANATEVRTLFKLGALGRVSQSWVDGSSSGTAQIQGINVPYAYSLKGITWAQTTTGMSSRLSEYYSNNGTGSASFTLTSYTMPLQSSSSTVTVIPHYSIFKLYDETNNSSIDGTVWTSLSGTGGENTSSIYFQGAEDYRTSDISGEKLISFNYKMDNIGTVNSYLRFYDGTNNVTIDHLSSAAPTTGNLAKNVLIRLDWANKRAYINRKGYEGNSHLQNFNIMDNFEVYDLSTLSTNLYLRFTPGGGSGSIVRVYGIRKGLTASPSSTITTAWSRDGTNFTSFTNGFGMSETTGSTITVKISGTAAANEVIVVWGWDILEELIV